MHHVRRWAHSAAHESRYNPWHGPADTAKPPDQVLARVQSQSTTSNEQPDPTGAEVAEPDKQNPKTPIFRRIWVNFRNAMLHSWVNVLLVFVPAGIAVHFAGIDPNVVFALNAIAIIPLAGLLTYATESVAHRLGPTWGALLNVSFGNAVELIIFIALVKNEIRIVQASLIGSILANLLLILGMAFLVGGLEYREQVYDSTVTQMSACLLALAVLSLLIPTAFHASFNDMAMADANVLKVSRGVSVILLVIYVLYLLFQLKSHAYLYQGIPQHIIDEQSQPGVLARFDSTSSSETSSTTGNSIRSTSTSSGSHRKIRKRIRAKLGMKRHSKTEVISESAQSSKAVVMNEKANEEVVQLDTPPMPFATENRHMSVSETDIARYSSARIQAQEDPDRIVTFNLPQPRPRPIRPQVTTQLSTPATTSFNPSPLSAASMSRRPAAAFRAFSSLRPPPVFRSSTNPQVPTVSHGLPQNQLRRLTSAPNAPNVALTPLATEPRTPLSKVDTNKSLKDQPPMSQTASIVLLLCSTALVAICAEFLVGSIEHMVESTPLSEAFIGLIILPIVGNAAEHVTAVTVAAKNKLDLSLGVSLGSSIQIALFVTPVVVILGWIMDKTMSLYFNLFEVASLFVSTFIVNFLVLDGRSNYLEGALLCACYIILAVAAYFFPNETHQSITSGAGGNSNG